MQIKVTVIENARDINDVGYLLVMGNNDLLGFYYDEDTIHSGIQDTIREGDELIISYTGILKHTAVRKGYALEICKVNSEIE